MCSDVVNVFLSGWVREVRCRRLPHRPLRNTRERARGAGARAVGSGARDRRRDLDRACWTGRPDLFGYDPNVLPTSIWSQRSRIHQYRGDHDETWGGVTINIDSNLVDGPIYPEDPYELGHNHNAPRPDGEDLP